LAAGIEGGALLADGVRRRGGTPTLVLLTDGQANVGRDGKGGRARAQADALAAARAVRAAGHGALTIDTSPRPNPAARALAAAMGGRYLALPQADAGSVSRVVRGLV
jgi:magnesium chelatase subunit D